MHACPAISGGHGCAAEGEDRQSGSRDAVRAIRMRENDDERPTEIGGFRLNFVLIAALHLLVLGAVLLLAILSTRKKEENVVWMKPGSFASGSPMSDGADAGASPDN